MLDVSGSMYEEDGTGISRLKRIQDAAIAAIQKLKPEDTLAIVAFAHNAQVMLPSTDAVRQGQDRGRDRQDRHVRRRSGRHRPWTRASQLGIDEVEKNAGTGKLSQVVVLTDGETSGEQMCRQLAQQAAQKKIHLTVMGVGTEWNASLIKDLAKSGRGQVVLHRRQPGGRGANASSSRSSRAWRPPAS